MSAFIGLEVSPIFPSIVISGSVDDINLIVALDICIFTRPYT